jgi:phospholipid transport system substrate-binding protein
MPQRLAATLCLLVLASPVLADAQDDKKAADKKAVATVVRKTVDRVLKIIRDEKISRPDKRRRVIAVMEPVVDFQLMAKLSLGRKHWPKLQTKQRKTFTDLLVETLRASYFDKLVFFSNEVVEYDDPIPKKNKFHVVSRIESKGERVVVVYKLYTRGGVWKVYDFEIEGVSIVKSYGSQYSDFLKEGTLDGLIKKLGEKVAAVRKREKELEKKNEKEKEKNEKETEKKEPEKKGEAPPKGTQEKTAETPRPSVEKSGPNAN